MHIHAYACTPIKTQDYIRNNNAKMLIVIKIKEINCHICICTVFSFAFFFQVFFLTNRTPSTIQQNKEPLHCSVSV